MTNIIFEVIISIHIDDENKMHTVSLLVKESFSHSILINRQVIWRLLLSLMDDFILSYNFTCKEIHLLSEYDHYEGKKEKHADFFSKRRS